MKQLISNLKRIAEDFEQAAKDDEIAQMYSEEDAEGIRDMYRGDAQSFRDILACVEDGDMGKAYELIHSLDTEPREVAFDDEEINEHFWY